MPESVLRYGPAPIRYALWEFKGILKKIFAAKIFSQIERSGAETNRHNLHFRQELGENNKFKEIFYKLPRLAATPWARGGDV